MEGINWASIITNLMALLAVLVPSLKVMLSKIGKIVEQGAKVAKETEEFHLVLAEALSDGNVNNEEINRIVKEAKDVGRATKELIRLIWLSAGKELTEEHI
jgi:hypothetical protein